MDYQEHEDIINKLMLDYANYKGRPQAKKAIYLKLLQHIDQYDLYLDEQSASYERKQWLIDQKRYLYELKSKQQLQAGTQVNIKQIKDLEEDIDKRLLNISKDVQQSIEASNFIQLQLNKQIERLDDLYIQNLSMEKKLERAKKGLLMIIRRAMLSKITRILAIILLLIIIAFIALIVLKKTDVLNI